MTEVAEPDSHSELPPSSADKWFNCYAWRREVAGIIDTSSAAAEEGTLAHLWLAEHLLGQRDLSDLDNEQMFDYLMSCVDWINEQTGERHVEQKLDYGEPFGYSGLTGTSDLVLVDDEMLTIGDLKYGRGLVEVEHNLQLLTYLAGAIHKYGHRPRYRLVILQPRAKHKDGPIREFSISHEEFMEFQEKLEKAIDGSYDRKSVHTVGPWCRKWCKALGTCPAARKQSLSILAQFPMDDD